MRINAFSLTRLGVQRRTIGSSLLLVICAAWACATLAATDAATPMPSAMDERVRACTSCHGAQGQGRDNDYFPRIAGKPADYLFNQLIAFRDGGRTYPPMGYLIAFLPDDYLHKISQYFADQQPPYPNSDTGNVPPAVLAYGERLVTHGDPARNPAFRGCSACTPAILPDRWGRGVPARAMQWRRIACMRSPSS